MTSALLVIGLLMTPAHAQDALEAAQWSVRSSRAKGFEHTLWKNQKGFALFRDIGQKHVTALRKHRADCRNTIRRGRRNSEWENARNCYRSQLVLKREYLERQTQFLDTLPGISERTRNEVIDTHYDLLEALDSTIHNLYDNAYTSIEEMQGAKDALRKHFTAAALARTHLRADRMLTWIAHQLLNMLQLVQHTAISDDTYDQLSSATVCFERGEALLRQVLSTDEYKSANTVFRQTLLHLETCPPFLREAHRIHTTEKQVLTEEDF